MSHGWHNVHCEECGKVVAESSSGQPIGYLACPECAREIRAREQQGGDRTSAHIPVPTQA